MIYLIVSLLLSINTVFADQVARQESEVSISDNGKFAYVYRINKEDSISLNFDKSLYPKIKKNDFSILDYPKNGLYEIESKKLLWEIDHSLFKNDGKYFEPTVFDDGAYLVVNGPWATSIDQTAFAIFNEGKLLKYYTIKDICSKSEFFSFTTSHFFWKDNYKLDKKNKKITFIACGVENSIDVTTGEITKVEIKEGKDLDPNLKNAYEQIIKAMDDFIQNYKTADSTLLMKNYMDAEECLEVFKDLTDQRYRYLLTKMQSKIKDFMIATEEVTRKDKKLEEYYATRKQSTIGQVCKFKLVENENLKKIFNELMKKK